MTEGNVMKHNNEMWSENMNNEVDNAMQHSTDMPILTR